MADRVVHNVSFTSDFVSKYQRGLEMTYELNGITQKGEFNVKMGSVAILLFDTDLQKFLLVTQFRPAVFAARMINLEMNHGKDYNKICWEDYDKKWGYTTELCAGLIDKEGLSPEEIAREEVAEECGYKVEKLTHIGTVIVGSHQSGNSQYLYYAEIDSSKKISEGGGNIHEGEVISKIYLTIEEARNYVYGSDIGLPADIRGPPGVLFALQWWFLKEKLNNGKEEHYKWSPKNVETISNISFSSEFDKKKYGYNPQRMTFTLDGITRTWDLALCSNSAACILIDSINQELILLEVLRVPVLIGKLKNHPENAGKPLECIDFENADSTLGVTLELPTTNVPNCEDPHKHAIKHLGKIGYKFKDLKLIATLIPGIGQSGDTQHIYFADVKDGETSTTQNPDEARFPFTVLRSLFQQPVIGPPNVYNAIGFVIEQINRKKI